MAFFSVIVPVYNVENYIKQCIDSILSQSYEDFELILVDDGSTDSSGKICDEYLMKDERVKVVHQSNSGAAKARNCGLKKAEGNFVYFIDSDDYLKHHNVFEKVCDIILNNNNIDLVKVKQIAFKDETEDFYSVYKYNNITQINGLNGVDSLLKLCETEQMVVSVYSYFIRRKVLIENDLFFIEGSFAEDINWVPRVFLSSTKVYTLDEFVYCRRQERPGQVTYKANLKRDLDSASILNDWFKQKESLLTIKNNKNSVYFWNYLANVYVGLISNQYYYSGEQAKKRISELSTYKYILGYLKYGKLKKLDMLYKIFGFRVYVKTISYIKRGYRFFN